MNEFRISVFPICQNRNKIKQESDELRSYLKKSQDNVNALLDEKRKLFETIRGLRVSLQITIL